MLQKKEFREAGERALLFLQTSIVVNGQLIDWSMSIATRKNCTKRRAATSVTAITKNSVTTNSVVHWSLPSDKMAEHLRAKTSLESKARLDTKILSKFSSLKICANKMQLAGSI